MRLDDEVLAVITAIVVVASVFAIAQILRPAVAEPFTAIGLLNQDCKIGDYPDVAVEGENLTLCIFVDNHMGYPIYYRVIYKLGTNQTLPTNQTPSTEEPLMEWEGILAHGENATFNVNVPVVGPAGRRALIFELWTYSPEHEAWVYTGRWVHLYVEVAEAPFP